MKRTELEAFLAVASLRSFSAAAAQLKLTQPAVSKRVAALETGLGAQLFDRIGKRVHLTTAGSALLIEAPKVLSALSDAERAIADLSGAPAGRLRVATSHHIGLHRLAPILRSYTRTYPEVKLDLRFEDSEDAHDLVSNGQVELAVVTLTDDAAKTMRPNTNLPTRRAAEKIATPVPPFREEVIWIDRLVFVVARDHPLVQEAEPTLALLAQQAAILPGAKTYTGRIVTALFQSAGLALEPALSTNYLETVRMLVDAGLGWSMLPERLCEGLHRLDLDDRAVRHLGLVINPRRNPSAAAKAFAETVRSFADPEITRETSA
ncbi:MAG: LysR family transcriptional regulator [Pseudomonadota bacterium]